jgi:hypothetical protein
MDGERGVEEIGDELIDLGPGWQGRKNLYPFHWLDLVKKQTRTIDSI